MKETASEGTRLSNSNSFSRESVLSEIRLRKASWYQTPDQVRIWATGYRLRSLHRPKEVSRLTHPEALTISNELPEE